MLCGVVGKVKRCCRSDPYTTPQYTFYVFCWCSCNCFRFKLVWLNLMRKAMAYNSFIFDIILPWALSNKIKKYRNFSFSVCSLISINIFTFFYINRKKYWLHENFRLPVFDRFTRFRMSWTRFDYFWKMSVCLCVCVCVTKILSHTYRQTHRQTDIFQK